MSSLTPREKQVVCLFAFPNAQIARLLGITESTVRQHIGAVGKKLEVSGGQTRVKILLSVLKSESSGITLEEVAIGDPRFEYEEY